MLLVIGDVALSIHGRALCDFVPDNGMNAHKSTSLRHVKTTRRDDPEPIVFGS